MSEPNRSRLVALVCHFACVCAMTLSASAAETGATKPLNLPLPDPLVAPDGHRITTVEEWTKEQRPRILELFRANE